LHTLLLPSGKKEILKKHSSLSPEKKLTKILQNMHFSELLFTEVHKNTQYPENFKEKFTDWAINIPSNF